MKLRGYFAAVLTIRSVLSTLLDWNSLKDELVGPNGGLVALTIAENWSNRPENFFNDVIEESWEKIIPLLSSQNMAEIKGREFEKNLFACRAFARYLPKLSRREFLPKLFRLAVYKLLAQNDNFEEGQTVQATLNTWMETYLPRALSSLSLVGSIAKAIPVSWMEQDGRVIINILAKSEYPRLGLFNYDCLAVLLSNSNDSCELITLNVLLSLSYSSLALISPSCIRSISGLGRMDLSRVVGGFRKNAFSKYNGPLTKETIQQLSAEQVRHYGSLLKRGKICKSLELHYLASSAASGITANCLYGYFDSQKQSNGLGKLWCSIPLVQIKNLTKHMASSLVNVPLKDFDSMTPKILEVMLYVHKVCPTVDITFWSGTNINYISSSCLHRIITETKGPVKLGKLWERINWLVVWHFTGNMKSSWLKIDHDDFQWMNPIALTTISSHPGICSALGSAFWTEDKIQYVSAQCLYELLTKGKVPVKLESRWTKVSPHLIYDFLKRVKFSWSFIHPEDFSLVRDRIGSHVSKYPSFSATFNISFWTKETIHYCTLDCLYNILHSARPVALGELWGDIPSTTIANFRTQCLETLKNVAGSDFQYMPPDLLKSVFSINGITKCLPQPSTGIIISPKASEVGVTAREFVALVRSAPSVAGQLLWYSKKLPGDVLLNCNGGDIRSIKLIIPGEAELGWKNLFAELEKLYCSDGRAESFSQMIVSISDGANYHFCATIENLKELLSLPWLVHNLGRICRSKLPFKVDMDEEGGVQLKAP